MDGFKSKLKSMFSSKSTPSYKAYTEMDLKTVTLKTRIVFDQVRNKCLQNIKASDSQLRTTYTAVHSQILAHVQNAQTVAQVVLMYDLLQEISAKIIEAESIVILKELLRKIQENRVAIIKTNGDMAKLKGELNWFRAALWFRKSKNVKHIDQLHDFCYNFFKGVDITSEIDVKCQIFQLYPMLGLLHKQKEQLPLEQLYQQLKHTLGWQIDPNILTYIIHKAKQQKSIQGNTIPKENPQQSLINSKVSRSSINSNNSENKNSKIIPKSQIRQPQQPQSTINPYGNQLQPPKSSINENKNSQSSVPNYYSPHPQSSYNRSVPYKLQQPIKRVQKMVQEPTKIAENQVWPIDTQKDDFLIFNKEETSPEKKPQNTVSASKFSMNSLFRKKQSPKKSEQILISPQELEVPHQQERKIETNQEIGFNLLAQSQIRFQQNQFKQQNECYQHNYNLDSNIGLLKEQKQEIKPQQKDQQQSSNEETQNIKEQQQQPFVPKVILDQGDRMLRSQLNNFDNQLQFNPFVGHEEPLQNLQHFESKQEEQELFKQIAEEPVRPPAFFPDTGSRIMRSTLNNFEQNNDFQFAHQDNQIGEKQQLFEQGQIEKEQERTDEAESLEIIRRHLGHQKQTKPIKKPYMVSIYARKQYTEKAHNNG